MVEHLSHSDSLSAMLNAIDSTRAGNDWIRFPGRNSSLNSHWDSLETLDCAVHAARTGQGREALAQRIQALAETLATALPAAQSIKRVPTWGRSGHRISVNRVLAGNLSHAWRGTTQMARPAHGRIVTVLLPVSFSARISETQIEWTIATSLAYALAMEQAGYRAELWAAESGTGTFTNDDDTLSMVRCKAAGAPWDSYSLATIAHPTFLRRLCFRVLEMLQPSVGPLGNYGTPYTPEKLRVRTALWAKLLGMAPDSLIYGPQQEQDIVDQRSATAWLQARMREDAA